MDVSVYRPDELTAATRTAWTTMQSEAHLRGRPQMANPFLSPGFTLAVGRCRRGVRVAVIREESPCGEPMAFFPYQRTPAGVGRAIGLGLSDCQGLVHGPGFQWDAHELLAACGLAVWEFDHLASGQQPFEQSATGSFPSPVIDVEEGWEAYLARLRTQSPKFTRTTLAKERKLGREYADVHYVHDERDPAALRTLMGWKSAQYRRTGRSDRFAHPGSANSWTSCSTSTPSRSRGSCRCSTRTAGRSPRTSGCAPSLCWPAGSRRTTLRSRSSRRA